MNSIIFIMRIRVLVRRNFCIDTTLGYILWKQLLLFELSVLKKYFLHFGKTCVCGHELGRNDTKGK